MILRALMEIRDQIANLGVHSGRKTLELYLFSRSMERNYSSGNIKLNALMYPYSNVMGMERGKR